jgi:hypothetical protein
MANQFLIDSQKAKYGSSAAQNNAIPMPLNGAAIKQPPGASMPPMPPMPPNQFLVDSQKAKYGTSAAANNAPNISAGIPTPVPTPMPLNNPGTGVTSGATKAGGSNPPMPPVYNAATNTGQVPMPGMGYGGGVYGKDAATNRALEANTTRLKTDPNFKQSEIERGLKVKADRTAAGLDTTAQDKYLASLGYTGVIDETPTETPIPVPNETSVPMPDYVTTPRSSSDLTQSSGDSLAIERAALENATKTYLGSLKNDYDYSNTLLQDNRNLENNAFNRSNSPFSGQTDYRSATLSRGRQIDDNYRASEFNNQSNQASQELYNFDKLAPERQREIYNKLLEAERQFGLNVGELTGVFGAKMGVNGATTGGTPTLAAQGLALQRDQFDYGKTQDQIQNDAQYDGTYGGNKTVQQQQQEWSNRYDYGNAIGQFENGQQTVASQELTYNKARDAITDTQWKSKFDEDVRQFGVNSALQKLQAGNDQSYRQAQLALQDDQNFISYMNAANKGNGSGTPASISSASAGDMLSQSITKITGYDDSDKPVYGKITDPANREKAFIDAWNTSGVSPGPDTIEMLAKAGYTTQEIATYKKNHPKAFNSGTVSGGSYGSENVSVPQSYSGVVNSAAKQYGVDPNLVAAIIKQESGFNPNARSGAGAMGLMQLMPGTASGLGVKNAFDPNQNVNGGTQYIKQMLDSFNGDPELALAAYNWGIGNVKKAINKYGNNWSSIRKYAPKETQGYVTKVLGNYRG